MRKIEPDLQLNASTSSTANDIMDKMNSSNLVEITIKKRCFCDKIYEYYRNEELCDITLVATVDGRK